MAPLVNGIQVANHDAFITQANVVVVPLHDFFVAVDDVRRQQSDML